MTDPVANSGGSSKVSQTDSDLYLDPSYNPLLAAMLASDISVSLAQANIGVVESGVPRLELPSGGDFYLKMQLEYGKIISSMLDSWSENNAKIEELRKEDNKKADRENDSLAREKSAKKRLDKQMDRNVGIADPITTRDIWHNGMIALFSLYRDEAQKAQGVESVASASTPSVSAPAASGNPYAGDLGGVHPSSAMTSALIIAAGFVGTFKTAETSGSVQLDNKVLQDAWNQIAVGHNQNDPTTQVAGWVSALWGIGLTYFTAAQEVGEIASSNKDAPKDLEFAVKYAENLIAGLATPAFNAQMRAIVVSNLGATEQADPQHTEQLSHMAKIVLLTVALGQIMKLEVGASYKDKTYQGHLTGDEVVAMLKGEIDFAKNDPQGLATIKAQLVAQINVLLGQVPESTRNALMANIKAYFNTNPSVEKMSDINTVVGAVFSANDMGEKHLGQNPM